MKPFDPDTEQNTDTLEHLLGVVVENREKRCAELREKAQAQAREITRQAHARSRARMHRHVAALREKYRQRISAALARNATLLRQQHQKADRAILQSAWPALREAIQALWKDPEARQKWLQAAMDSAAASLLDSEWHIEHPADLYEEDKKRLKREAGGHKGKGPKFSVDDDIEAGIRISAHGTVVDATLDGLLRQQIPIESSLIARIKQGAESHE